MCELLSAATYGRIENVRLLLDRGANIEHTDKYHDTALTWAAHGGHIEIIRLLLNHGVNIEHTDIYGDTTLQRAIKKGHVRISQMLQAALVFKKYQNLFCIYSHLLKF